MKRAAADETKSHSLRVCVHCGSELERAETSEFCCVGCEAVHGLLVSRDLAHYYDLRGEKEAPLARLGGERRDLKWLEEIDARRQGADASSVELDIQGLHCSACVWLIETIFRRSSGARDIVINPAIGRVRMVVDRSFDLMAFVRDVERFGYLFGRPLKRAEPRASQIALRMGICIAIAMNEMIFGIATYAGLHDGPTYWLFQRTSIALGFASVIIGGSVFFKSAWRGLRRGILHLDLPISLGIVFAFVGSLVSFAAHRAGGVFIDTLSIFIALMLVGRWLQERVLERNRLVLLANDGVDGLLARKVAEGHAKTVACSELRKGDVIAVAHEDLVPLDAVLQRPDEASFSLDWINGESRARVFRRGDTVPAGAFLASRAATELTAVCDFEESPLPDLLRTPIERPSDAAMSMPWWRVVAKRYVAFVLAAAAVGFFGWLLVTHDLPRALEVTTAVLIVTCPCAFGIAMPLAYDLVQSTLRRAGLYVRSAGFLDRAARVRTVVFDKTGTLTTGALTVADPDTLKKLDPRSRRALLAMAAASSHPKSAAIARALTGELVLVSSEVVEVPGRGLSLTDSRGEWRLGLPSWVAPGKVTLGDVAFGRNGRVVADIVTRESLRADAAAEVGALGAEGYDVWLLSGDNFARAAQTARLAGVAADHALGEQSVTSKASWIAEHDREDLLMVGDGINDSLAVSTAFCSGTPAIDRPFMAARSDFYFVTPGLRPIRIALESAKKLEGVRRRNLTIAIAYNLAAVLLAYAGLMSPLLCAVLMPSVSLVTIFATLVSLSPKNVLPSRSS